MFGPSVILLAPTFAAIALLGLLTPRLLGASLLRRLWAVAAIAFLLAIIAQAIGLAAHPAAAGGGFVPALVTLALANLLSCMVTVPVLRLAATRSRSVVVGLAAAGIACAAVAVVLVAAYALLATGTVFACVLLSC